MDTTATMSGASATVQGMTSSGEADVLIPESPPLTGDMQPSGSAGVAGAPLPDSTTEDAALGVAGADSDTPVDGSAAVLDGTTDAANVGDEEVGPASEVILPEVSSVEDLGPFAVLEDLRAGPSGRSGLFRPEALGKHGGLHPIVIFGCGGGSTPANYARYLSLLASQGFVVVAEVSAIGDDGVPLLATLDWLIEENERADSEFFHQLDISAIAMGGHSIGSVNTFRVAADPRLSTSFHVAGGSLDDVNNPRAPTSGSGGAGLVHPAAFICSESDIFGNVEKTELDYAQATVPVFFTVMSGSEHVGAMADGMPVLVAWLRWHLAHEDYRRASFLDGDGEFRMGRFVSQSKNW